MLLIRHTQPAWKRSVYIFYSGYLLLHNKLSQNLVAENNIFFFLLNLTILLIGNLIKVELGDSFVLLILAEMAQCYSAGELNRLVQVASFICQVPLQGWVEKLGPSWLEPLHVVSPGWAQGSQTLLPGGSALTESMFRKAWAKPVVPVNTSPDPASGVSESYFHHILLVKS